jgi:uncharacterized protein (DUF1697 family)
MNSAKVLIKYIGFLRGINVGGHHKVPMAELKMVLEHLSFHNILTLLNSGNIIFEAESNNTKELEDLLAKQLQESFGFPIPVIIRNARTIEQLFQANPFKGVPLTKDIRWYVSFLKNDVESDLQIPWKSPDLSFEILGKYGKAIISFLDLNNAKTPKAMEVVEKFYGKDITTRNWKTIEKIINKL